MSKLETKQIETPVEQDWGSRDHVQTMVLMMLATVLGVMYTAQRQMHLLKKAQGQSA